MIEPIGVFWVDFYGRKEWSIGICIRDTILQRGGAEWYMWYVYDSLGRQTYTGLLPEHIERIPIAPPGEPGRNTLITIGQIGDRHAYLNIPEAAALARYLAACPEDPEPIVFRMEFADEFLAYEVWPPRPTTDSGDR